MSRYETASQRADLVDQAHVMSYPMCMIAVSDGLIRGPILNGWEEAAWQNYQFLIV